MGLLNPHLDDAAFARLWTDRTSGDDHQAGSAERHLQACADCRVRYATFTDWLDSTSADAHAEADEVFTTERLAVQQAQIQRRLEALEHPARVIAFPRFARPISVQHSPSRRWVAVAAAAGLIVGVGVGQVLELGRTNQARPAETPPVVARTLPPTDVPLMAVRPIADSGDDQYLYFSEFAPSQVRVPESLQYLNAITPLSRDYDPR